MLGAPIACTSPPNSADSFLCDTSLTSKALIKWLAETPLCRVVFEPTGRYHRAVERALGASGVSFVKVNPRQARRFAEATGKLAKTDRLDAAILARMVHNPALILVYESGTIGAKPFHIPLSIGDGELAETADSIVSEGVATKDEVMQALETLERLAANPRTLICGPRVFQLWSRR